jgi:hypothetical protein
MVLSASEGLMSGVASYVSVLVTMRPFDHSFQERNRCVNRLLGKIWNARSSCAIRKRVGV